MTDKNTASKKERSFSLYLLVAMVVLVVIVVGLVAINDYYKTQQIFNKNSQHLKTQTEQNIIAAIKLTDESYNLYDSSLNGQMRQGFDVVLAEYERTSGIASKMNLTSVKQTLGDQYDIYVINESGVIEYSTYKPDLGLDFKKIPYFFTYLTRIRNSEGFYPDRIVEEQAGSRMLRKYAYMPTPDHRYILELGLAKTSFSSERSTINYKTAIDRIASANPYIDRIRIFNSIGKLTDNTSDVLDEPTRNNLENVLRKRADITVTMPGTGNSVKYLFIDLMNAQYGSDLSRIVEITYNNTKLEKASAEHGQFHLIVAILALIIGIFSAIILSRYLTEPISGIVRDVDRISEGDLDRKISSTHMAEFHGLEQSINAMVFSLKTALREVQDEKKFQLGMIDQLPVAVFMKSVKDGKYILWNKASEQIFNKPADEVIGKTDKELFSIEDVIVIDREDKEACLNQISISNKKISNKYLGQRIIHMIVVPIFDSDNNLKFMFGIGEDITEETLKMKIDLLFSMTRRDILDQLSVIVNYLERAQLKTSHESMQAFFEKTLESVDSIRNQMAFVRSLQDLGITSPAWQPVKKAFHDAVLLMQITNVDISVEMEDIELFADPLFPRVFYNLLANSIDHGDHQLTKIRLYTITPGESLTLVYEDNGAGIPHDEKEKIFEFGYGKGTGFGLFLVRELLAYTGITITETGEPGKGAKFEIVVPKGKFRIVTPE